MGSRINEQNNLIALYDLVVLWYPANVEKSDMTRRKALIIGIS